ncbi:ABC transporter substrate-binding protein [Zooshikella ganghwensis]|uniref:ABC transporter substrate-binding protein n=1 Tax=Zooshikella ganghwensis TaxID=202772 RepID=UPI00040157B3|nr:ABC transporter substrate binding protein [Zooshikella ganghwensis]
MKKIMKLLLLGMLIYFSNYALAANKVLLIESYHADYPWDISYVEGLRSVFESKEISLLRFQMDTKRVPSVEYQQKADEAWAYYQQVQPDLVILGDDNALKFLAEKFSQTNTPVVYLGINSNPNKLGITKYKNITGILERPLFKKSIAQVKEILPNAKKLLILFDNGTTSTQALEDEFKGKKTGAISGIKIDIHQIGILSEWKSAVSSAKESGYDAIITGLYHTLRDGNDKSVDSTNLIEWTSENTPVPMFAFWDFAVGPKKAIGGLVLYGFSQGQAAGKMAMDILSGKQPSSIRPKIGEKGRNLYSKSLLEKWSITLPDSIAKRADYID